MQRRVDEEEEEPIQAKGEGGGSLSLSSAAESSIASLRGTGSPLHDTERAFFEPHFGSDFSDVRVHACSQAGGLAEALQAKAFTVGSDIIFGRGEYSPGTAEGGRLLAHELTHVVQQEPAHGLEISGIASSGLEKGVQRAVRSVSCQNPSGRVRDIVGDDPFGTVQAADARAIELLDNAIAELVRDQAQTRGGEQTAWPVISDALARALRGRFGIDPEDREIWTSRQHLTRRGSPTISLLLFRLNRVRETLASGGIRYRCLDRPPCPPMSKPNEVVLGPLAWSDPEEYRIYLCEGFWRDLAGDGRALLLVHEAFHIYFGGIDRGRNMWNAHCIENFIADANGVTIPADSEGCCAPGAVCEY